MVILVTVAEALGPTVLAPQARLRLPLHPHDWEWALNGANHVYLFRSVCRFLPGAFRPLADSQSVIR